MRNLSCCLAITALALTAAGCHKEHKQAAHHPQPPQAEHPPVAQAPPEQPMAPQMPPSEAHPPAHPGMAQQHPGPQVMRTTHDLVVDALVCGLPPGSMAAMVGPRGGGPSMSPSGAGMNMEARCNALAPNVSAADFSQLDEMSVRAVRDAIERRAAEERLDDTARMQMLALYDRGIEAEREAMQAMQIGDRFSLASQAAQPSGPPERRMHAQIEPADLGTLSARDRLGDLLLFARASGSGALATEAEGLAWVLAADRFLQVVSLPPPIRVFAAEPLFESMLGVPTPQQAQNLDINRVTKQVWTQYLETAARAVEMMPGPQQPSGQNMRPSSMERSQREAKAHVAPQRPRGPVGGGRGQQGAAGPAMSAEEQQNMQKVVSLVSQRMEALSRRMPASDLRMTLDSYAAELRQQPSIGGGPRQQSQPQPSNPNERPKR